MSNKKMMFYWGSGSPPCWRPMIVLAEKGMWKDIQQKQIEFSKGGHKSDEIMKLNPRGQVPTFKDGEVVVNDSRALCMYLEDTYPTKDKPLYPKDSAAKALCFQRMFEVDEIVAKVMLPTVYYKMQNKKETWDAEVLKANFIKAREELTLWNTNLNEKDFLAGNSFSMADVYFYPLLAIIVRQGGKLDSFPNLAKYYTNLSQRQSIKDTVPPHWAESDSPGYLADL